jgi:acetyltransferase-like isoleucine patch superfamily enzyme
MFILRWIAQALVLVGRIWTRSMNILLRPAFKQHGRNFIFDPSSHFTYQTIAVGDDVSIGGGAIFMASESNIIIGNKVMFGPNVIVVGGNHNTSVVGKFMYDIHEKRPGDDQDVIFEDDVWVGAGAMILKGVRVGRGSIVAAGAVVNKDVPPYTVVGGIPAKVIAPRFAELETVLNHEAALYPPEKRLDQSTLASAFDHVSARKN